MILFPLLIIITLVMYIYYKVTILKIKDPLLQVYNNSKARIFLGLFMIAFGINQYVYYQTSIALYVTIVFILLGSIQTYSGYKQTLHYRKELKKRELKEA